MKFDYCAEIVSEKYFFPAYHFRYTLTEDEVKKVLHKYGDNKRNYMNEVFEYSSLDQHYKAGIALGLIRDTLLGDTDVDLGIDYKKKYEELVELLEPHKIDDMPPETTLKMILQYAK
jgi:hypothetical protein